MSEPVYAPLAIRLSIMGRLYKLTVPIREDGDTIDDWMRHLGNASPIESDLLKTVESREAANGVFVLWTWETRECVHNCQTCHVRDEWNEWRRLRRTRLRRALRSNADAHYAAKRNRAG